MSGTMHALQVSLPWLDTSLHSCLYTLDGLAGSMMHVVHAGRPPLSRGLQCSSPSMARLKQAVDETSTTLDQHLLQLSSHGVRIMG